MRGTAECSGESIPGVAAILENGNWFGWREPVVDVDGGTAFGLVVLGLVGADVFGPGDVLVQEVVFGCLLLAFELPGKELPVGFDFVGAGDRDGVRVSGAGVCCRVGLFVWGVSVGWVGGELRKRGIGIANFSIIRVGMPAYFNTFLPFVDGDPRLRVCRTNPSFGPFVLLFEMATGQIRDSEPFTCPLWSPTFLFWIQKTFVLADSEMVWAPAYLLAVLALEAAVTIVASPVPAVVAIAAGAASTVVAFVFAAARSTCIDGRFAVGMDACCLLNGAVVGVIGGTTV